MDPAQPRLIRQRTFITALRPRRITRQAPWIRFEPAGLCTLFSRVFHLLQEPLGLIEIQDPVLQCLQSFIDG